MAMLPDENVGFVMKCLCLPDPRTGRSTAVDHVRLFRRHPALRFILAGGLKPENVAAAVQTVRPNAVDVASGVEAEGDARRKDAGRMAQFFAAVCG